MPSIPAMPSTATPVLGGAKLEPRTSLRPSELPTFRLDPTVNQVVSGINEKIFIDPSQMRLTVVNFLIRKKPHGYQFRGKYRVVKEVKVPALREQYDYYQLQEQNMLILRHPYLTVEQSTGHMGELRAQKRDPAVTYLGAKKDKKFARHYTWAEQLTHLRVKDAWD